MNEIIWEYLKNIQYFLSSVYSNIIYYLDEFMNFITGNFTNRELASGFLILLFIIFAISVKPARRCFRDIIKMLLSFKLMLFNSLMIAYFILIVFVIDKLGFWENSMWKSSIIWFIFTAIIFTVNAITKKDISYKYFKDLIKDSFKIFILIQFLMNMQSFSFITEVVILSVLICITILVAMLEHYEEFNTKGAKILHSILNYIQIMIVLIILSNSIKITLNDIENIELVAVVKDILLPSILTLMFIPFTYISVIFTSYELLFTIVGFKKTIDKKIRVYLYFRIILVCGLSIKRVREFTNKSNVMCKYINNMSDVNEIIIEYKNRLKTRQVSI